MQHPGADRKKQNLVVASLFVAVLTLIITLYIGLKQDPKDIAAQYVGKPAINFTAAWIQGQELLSQPTDENFRLENFRGKNVILNFWASWCVSCRTEALDLEAFHQKYQQGDTVVVGIAIQDTIEAARNFAAQYGKQYILGLDKDGKVSIDYGVTGVPETIFIDKNGIVRYKHVGPVTMSMLEEMTSKYF
jgi:cytochrome c biogenesis protein CcmG/thiol:disulfide interchange protein DsbE